MTEELIEQFFNKQCTAQEAVIVARYLKDNPAVLEKYLSVRDWETSDLEQMPQGFWNETWVKLQRRRFRSYKITRMKQAAIAAAIVIVAGLVYNGLAIHQSSAVLVSKQQEIIKPEHRITANTSAVMMNIDLPDSSKVALSPGSTIGYNIPFADRTRDINLEGEARFKVMKNKEKPFTVFAGGLATTALGTEFTINTKDTLKNNVSVKLHTGRVVITATGELLKHWKKNIYLSPGNQLVYDAKKQTATVNEMKNESGPDNIAKKNGKAIPFHTPGLSFVNTSLPEVMIKLSGYYHETIHFDSTALNEMNFTGTISRTDSLHIVLKVIAQMNGLELNHNEKGYDLKLTEK